MKTNLIVALVIILLAISACLFVLLDPFRTHTDPDSFRIHTDSKPVVYDKNDQNELENKKYTFRQWATTHSPELQQYTLSEPNLSSVFFSNSIRNYRFSGNYLMFDVFIHNNLMGSGSVGFNDLGKIISYYGPLSDLPDDTMSPDQAIALAKNSLECNSHVLLLNTAQYEFLSDTWYINTQATGGGSNHLPGLSSPPTLICRYLQKLANQPVSVVRLCT